MTNRQILMADDDVDDRFLVKSAFEDNDIPNPVVFFEDGEQLINHLSLKENDNPLLILLDLNMPKRDGRDVLKALRTEASWFAIPIIIFSTSNSPDDVNYAYQNGANCYIIKPSSYEGLKAMIRNIQRFWLNTASLPQ